MSVSTTITNSSNLYLYYEKKLLSTLQPRLQLFKLGKKQKLPKGYGKQVKWLRYAKIASNVNAITEGVAPSEISFTTSNVTANVLQYGQFSKVSDLLSDTAIDPVLENLAELFGRAAAETVEDLIIAELDAQASVQYQGGAANDAALTTANVLNHKDLIHAMIAQKIAYIGPHEMGNYMAVIHPSCQYDLLADSQTGSWFSMNKYVAGSDGQEKLLRGEFGQLYGARLLVSDKMTSANTGAGGISVKNNYMVGEEAFGVVELNGSSINMIVKDNKSGGVANPLEQFSTVGYKIHGFAAKYLDASSKRVISIHATSAMG